MANGQKEHDPSDDEPAPADEVGAAGGETGASSADEGAALAEQGGEPEADEADADEEDEGERPAAQLGSERYVVAGFFAAGMVCAYVIGQAIHGLWAYVANRDWFSRTLPALAAVSDDDKTTYGMVVGAVVAFVAVLRTYRNPEVRTWSRDVAAELAKVKWPTKKDVSSSTMVVIAASTVATIYLALLDRLWTFVTNLVYGDGS